jgi:hypothetical protein
MMTPMIETRHIETEFIVADYRFAALPGVGHYAAEPVPAGQCVGAGALRRPPP